MRSLSICISVYLGPPLSPTATRAKDTLRWLKPLKWWLKPLKWWLKPLAVAKVHAHWWLKYTQLSTERT